MVKTKVNAREAMAANPGPAGVLEEAQAAKAVNAATPGTRTTEFWLAVAVIVAALVLTLASKISGDVGMGAIASAGGLYALSRGLAKT